MALFSGSLADYAGGFAIAFHVCGVFYFIGATCYYSAPLARRLKHRLSTRAKQIEERDASLTENSINTIWLLSHGEI